MTLQQSERPFREQIWGPQVGDLHVLYAGLKRISIMTVIRVEPHRIVTEELQIGKRVPILRYFRNIQDFAITYRVTADPYSALYPEE